MSHKLIKIFSLLATLLSASMFYSSPIAKADYFNYPCNYPFVVTSVEVRVFVQVNGQYCDGPTEINWSHYHCAAGDAGVSGNGIGIVGIPLFGGATAGIGGIGGGPLGGGGGNCEYECPDMTRAPFPNPPRAWINYMVLREKDNDCRDHMKPAGQNQESPSQHGLPVSNAVPPEPAPVPPPEDQPPPVDAPKPEPFLPGDGFQP